MNICAPEVFVYLLIDNGLLQEVSASYTETDVKNRPKWLAPIYAERALAISPILIDLEAAYEAGDLDEVMCYVNALRPALHVSIIETCFSLEEITGHLRRFTFILDPEEKQFTLRFADCAVLTPLSSALTAALWATFKGPITRWGIHDRSGAIIQLPPVQARQIISTPLCFDHRQLAALDEASEPDHYIAKVKMMRHGEPLPGNSAEQYAWAKAAHQAWSSSGNSNPLILMHLTEAQIVTQGRILHSKTLGDLLVMNDVSAFRSELQELVDETSTDEIRNHLQAIPQQIKARFITYP